MTNGAPVGAPFVIRRWLPRYEAEGLAGRAAASVAPIVDATARVGRNGEGFRMRAGFGRG
jgi:hypothetical protein